MLDHSEQGCVLRIRFSSGTQSMRTVHFRFSLHNNLVWVNRFDLAEVNENGTVCWNIQFTFCVFCLLAIVIQEIHNRIVLTGENRKHEFVLLKKRRKRHFVILF